jgi:8-oxo-dGTP pyrophosphatase MutT (NUDIX family)
MLLVKDKGVNKYSLPGGGIHNHERSAEAAKRELYEETGLRVKKVSWIGSFKSPVTEHRAYLIEAEGRVHLKRHGELKKHIWWNMKKPIPIFAHVSEILKMVQGKT